MGSSVAERRSASVSGPVLFARYALGPNRLGYCGPDEPRSLLAGGAGLGVADGGETDGGLRRLAQGFEVAYPYLELIASANGIADALDRRVVDAYWLGNELTSAVRADDLHRHLDDGLRRRLPAGDWRWLERAAGWGARPVHAFHVLDVFRRTGALRGDGAQPIVHAIDACRIRWGRVEAIVGDHLVVATRRLELADGELRLSAPQPESVERWWDGIGFVDDVEVGGVVSLHWGWACGRLDAAQQERLHRWTSASLAVANRTI